MGLLEVLRLTEVTLHYTLHHFKSSLSCPLPPKVHIYASSHYPSGGMYIKNPEARVKYEGGLGVCWVESGAWAELISSEMVSAGNTKMLSCVFLRIKSTFHIKPVPSCCEEDVATCPEHHSVWLYALKQSHYSSL